MKILFLCTGNACRSQMAEGWAGALANPAAVIRSAGIKAHGLNPRAVQVMLEAGVDISAQTSKVINACDFDVLDLVVTVCGHADEHCPVVPARVEKIHWALPDPAGAEGSTADIETVFRVSRDDIRDRVRALLINYDCLNAAEDERLVPKR
jgi:arsenate reductase